MAIENVSVVVAHGAWADGASWARVITALDAYGTKVVAAPLPLTSLADDVAALNRSIERMPGPVVLAGHAYAGAVIALARPERVKALVYVTALAPDEGEKVADVFYRAAPHPAGAEACAGQQQLDLAARRRFRQGVRAERIRGGLGAARGRTAAVIGQLHHGSCRAAAVEGCSQLVSGRGGGSHDRPRDAALYGEPHEGESESACG